jgi:pilus assembly protein CpaB
MARTLTQARPERTNRLLFMGAVGLAAIAAIFVFVALSNFGGTDGGGGGGSGSAVVTTQDVGVGTVLTADMLQVVSVPGDALVAGAFTDKSKAVGLKALYPLAKGEQVSSAKVVGKGAEEGKGIGWVTPPGKRAVSVEIDQTTSAGGLIVAGDHVDVIVVGKTKANVNGESTDIPASFTLLEDVEVLAVAQDTLKPVSRVDENGNPVQADTAEGSIAAGNNNDPSPKAKTVTLAVTPEQAARLALGTVGYTVVLSARPPGDASHVNNPNDIVTLPPELQ